MTTTSHLITAEQMLAMPDLGRCELIRGEICSMSPPGYDHSVIGGELFGLIRDFLKASPIGVVTQELGFVLERNPDTVRAPDVACIANASRPTSPHPSYVAGPPSLAVEVLSPTNRPREVRAKVEQWAACGTISVWVVDPPNRTISVYRTDHVSVH